MPSTHPAIVTTLALALFLGACSAEEDVVVETMEATPETAEAPALPRSDAAEGARVFFITPADGDVVSNPIAIEFGVEGMTIVPAGTNEPNSGHHHLLINTGLPPLNLPIPADDNHVHFGDGSNATVIELPSGEHTLQMLLGDHLHIPHQPPLASDVITITVE